MEDTRSGWSRARGLVETGENSRRWQERCSASRAPISAEAAWLSLGQCVAREAVDRLVLLFPRQRKVVSEKLS